LVGEEKPKILVILGPTASGKSTLAIELAKRFGGEIVGSDSLQVHRYLDIGTAKPSKEVRALIPHHIIDIVDPDEEFNVGMYRKLAGEVILDLHRGGKRIILVGGTFLYVRALLYGLIEGIEANEDIRTHLRGLRKTYGTYYLHEKLKEIDPDSAKRIHPNDYVRIERALEAYYITGKRMSELQREHGFGKEEYRTLKIGLKCESRETLGKRIEDRVDRMIEEGWVEEVKKLRAMGYGRDLKPMQAIGYREISRYLEGEILLEEAITLIKRSTKQYARRQLTWLKKDKEINWYRVPEDLDKVLYEAEKFFF